LTSKELEKNLKEIQSKSTLSTSAEFIRNNSERIYSEIETGRKHAEEYIRIDNDGFERFIRKTPTTMSLMENMSLVENMNVDDGFEEILNVNEITKFEIHNMIEILKNNKHINVASYDILNTYATKSNQNVSEVIKQYKSSNDAELPRLISKVIKTNLELNDDIERIIVKDFKYNLAEHAISTRNEIDSKVNEYKSINSIPVMKKEIETNIKAITPVTDQKITSSDLDDLFS
jgi:hypothetical protein